MSNGKPLTDFIEGFLVKQEERERLVQEKRAQLAETFMESFRGTLLEALGVDALAELKPEWGVQKAPANYALAVLHYKGETFTLKDVPRLRLEMMQKKVAEFVLEVDEEQKELSIERAKLFETLKTRPLPDHVTSSWWNRIQHIVGDDTALLGLWDRAMAIFDVRVQEAKAQEEERRSVALEVSNKVVLEIVADIENCDDERRINALRDDIPSTIMQGGRRRIQEAAFERLQELDREYEREQDARRARILEIERTGFWPFHFYEVHYQTGVLYEDGLPGVETAVLQSYSHECTQIGWWFAAEGGRVQLPFVCKVVECVVCAPDDYWPLGMWEIKETDDGLKYRVPSPLAVRADVDACAQAKEV